MLLPPQSLLRAHEHWVDAFGLPPEAWARITALSRRLPAAFQSFYLEQRLDAHDAQLDFLALAERSRGGFEAIVRFARSSSPGAASGWSVLESYCRADHAAEHVWLEFDCPVQHSGGEIVPSLCVCVEEQYLARHDAAHHVKKNQAGLASTQQVLGALMPEGLSAGLRASLQTVFEAIPASGNVIHVCAMLGRQPCQVKLYVSVSQAELLSFLAAIGWSGDPRVFSAALPNFDGSGTAYVDLSLAPHVQNRIGLACSQFHLSHATSADPEWRAVLNHWQRTGLCSSEKAERAMRWPGFEATRMGEYALLTTRYLDLKLVLYGAQRSVAAKAYFGFRVEPLPPIVAAAMTSA